MTQGRTLVCSITLAAVAALGSQTGTAKSS